MINDSQITAIGLATQEELDELRAMSKRINELMTELFAKGGVRLVDFKLEFGRTDEGLVLCDEISPDSCRLWDMETNKNSIRTDSAATSAMFSAATEMCSKDLKALSDKFKECIFK